MEREHNSRRNRAIRGGAQLPNGSCGLPGIRRDVVARIRIQIARGTYATPQKLETAVCRLIQDVRALDSLGF
jgi:hypothetical protein